MGVIHLLNDVEWGGGGVEAVRWNVVFRSA